MIPDKKGAGQCCYVCFNGKKRGGIAMLVGRNSATEIMGSENLQQADLVNLLCEGTIINGGRRGSSEQGQIHSNYLLGHAFLGIDANGNRKFYVLKREGFFGIR